MRAQDIYVSGMGVFLPEILSVETAVERGLFPADQVEGQGYTGIAVAGDLPAPEMALRAGQDALKQSQVSPSDIAALFYVDSWHQGPEGWLPQFYLQHYLVGDGADMLAVEVKHGCNGTFSAIELAIGTLRAESQRKAALITASDNFGTPHMNRWDPGGNFCVAGDGSSALVLTKEPGFAQLLSFCTDSFSIMEEACRAGVNMFPPGPTVGQQLDFFARVEAFKQKAVAEGIAWTLPLKHQQKNIGCMRRALAEAGVEASDITRVIVHNLAREETEPYLGVLGFPLAQSTWDYGRGIGHLGASDHVISIHHLLTTDQLRAGDHLLLCGFGAGNTYKAAVIKILAIPEWVS
jgi:clorobiocin biosynthesis protein CloN2